MISKNPIQSTSEEVNTDRLTDRLDQLELQIERLANLLHKQATTRKRRRRLITIRFLLCSFIGFALFFAWFGRVYHQSQQQAAAVDQLASQSIFVIYSPRDSVLVSLMPGDSESPPRFLNRMFGIDFFRAVTNVSTQQKSALPRNKKEIIASLASLSELQRLRLINMQLTTRDLAPLGRLRDLQSLDIARTTLDGGSMRWMRNVQLRWLNASHTRLGDRALYDLSHCTDMQKLNLERTAITDAGLKHLSSLSNLRYLNLKRCPVSLAEVKLLSDAIPNCVIDWEPLRFLPNGQVDVLAARKGKVQFGSPIGEDPRMSHRAHAPLDRVPARANTVSQPGFLLDVY